MKRARPTTSRKTTVPRSRNGGFAPGKSGNPSRRFGQPGGNPTDRGGRLKLPPAIIREKAGEGAEALIDELMHIAGDRRRGAWGRVSAIRELLDRGWGKAPQHVHVVHEPLPAAQDWSRLTDGEFELLSVLMERAEGAEVEPGMAQLPVLTVSERWGDKEPNGQLRRILEAKVVWLPREEAIAQLTVQRGDQVGNISPPAPAQLGVQRDGQ